MSTAAIFNRLAQSIIPQIAAAAFPDTLTIKEEQVSAGTGGGRIKSGAADYATGVPCAYEAKKAVKRDSANKLVSLMVYIVTMPTHLNGSRLNLDPRIHRLDVDARGNEPAKTFRIIAIGDDMGVVFEVTCEREN